MSGVSDPRFARFISEGLQCSCGERHQYIYPLHMVTPAGFPSSAPMEPDDALRMDGNFLSASYCVLEGKHFAIRMRLPIPLKEAMEYALMFSVWCAMDRPDFEAYVAAVKANALQQDRRAYARLVNRIGGFPDTLAMMGVAAQQTDGGWPLFLTDLKQADGRNDHQLAIEQRRGASADRIFELYAKYGHDMRSA